MTNKQLKSKLKSMLKEDKKAIDKYIEKVILSGSIDIEAAENNYILPKMLLSAIYKEMSFQYKPFSYNRQTEKEIDNIYAML